MSRRSAAICDARRRAARRRVAAGERAGTLAPWFHPHRSVRLLWDRPNRNVCVTVRRTVVVKVGPMSRIAPGWYVTRPSRRPSATGTGVAGSATRCPRRPHPTVHPALRHRRSTEPEGRLRARCHRRSCRRVRTRRGLSARCVPAGAYRRVRPAGAYPPGACLPGLTRRGAPGAYPPAAHRPAMPARRAAGQRRSGGEPRRRTCAAGPGPTDAGPPPAGPAGAAARVAHPARPAPGFVASGRPPAGAARHVSAGIGRRVDRPVWALCPVPEPRPARVRLALLASVSQLGSIDIAAMLLLNVLARRSRLRFVRRHLPLLGRIVAHPAAAQGRGADAVVGSIVAARSSP